MQISNTLYSSIWLWLLGQLWYYNNYLHASPADLENAL